MISLNYFLTIGAVLFTIGVFGVLVRRNAISILMSVELILNAANINLIAFNRYLGDASGMGQVFALIIIAVAAASSVVGLVLIISIYRNTNSIFTDEFHLMKW